MLWRCSGGDGGDSGDGGGGGGDGGASGDGGGVIVVLVRVCSSIDVPFTVHSSHAQRSFG